MKRLLLFITCILLLSGCEKKVDVIQKEDGYEIEKIASISLNIENGYRDISYSNQIIYVTDYSFEGENMNQNYYEIDLSTNEVKEAKKPKNEEITDKSVIYDDGCYDRKSQAVLKETANYKIILENITKVVDGKFEKRITKYFYETKDKIILLYEKEINELSEDEGIYNYNSYYFSEQLGDLLLYCESNEILVNKIADGKLEVIDKFLIDDENYHMTWMGVTNDEYNVIYESEEMNKFIVGDEIYEFDKNEGISTILKDYILVSKKSDDKEIDDVGIVQTRLIDRNTQKSYELSQSIGFCFDDYENNRILTYNDEGKYCFMDLNTEQIIQRNLPFESNFNYIQINENQYIFYDLSQPDFYKVTLK